MTTEEYPLEEIGRTEEGYTIFRQKTIVGGWQYWSEEIGGGIMIFDSSITSPKSVEFCLKHFADNP